MKATKYTLNIEIQVLSKDTIPGLLIELEGVILKENDNGSIVKADGDQVTWMLKSEPVEF